MKIVRRYDKHKGKGKEEIVAKTKQGRRRRVFLPIGYISHELKLTHAIRKSLVNGLRLTKLKYWFFQYFVPHKFFYLTWLRTVIQEFLVPAKQK